MAPSIQQQASQAAQQGQQLLSDFNSRANTSNDQYNTYSNQANQATQQEQSEADYMKGEGSGENVYNRELTTQENNVGFNPQQLSDANKSLFQLTGALNSTNNQFNTAGGVGMYGVSAPAMASYEGSILNPLQTGVANANTQVGTLNNELGTLETGASQATTSQVQSEQNVVTALDSASKNYQAQAAAALQNVQFFKQLAQQQGGLNAQEQQYYAGAVASYAQASELQAQAGLLLSQTTGQNYQNEAAYNQLHPNPNTIGGGASVNISTPTPNVSAPQHSPSSTHGSFIPSDLSAGFNNIAKYGPLALFGAH